MENLNIDKKKIVKVNNKYMVEFLESYIGSQIAKAFHDFGAYMGVLEREQIETIAVCPILLKVWEKDEKTNEQVLKDRIGFDLLIETDENKTNPYKCTYLFDDEFKIENALNVYSVTETVPHKNKMMAFEIFNNYLNNSQELNENMLLPYSFVKNRDLDAWRDLVQYDESLIFDNNGKNITVKTIEMKDWLDKKISCSEQLQNLIYPIKREIKNVFNMESKNIVVKPFPTKSNERER